MSKETVNTKRKVRVTSSESSTTSLEEKKLRKSSQNSNEEDEVFSALQMAENVGEQLKLVLSKLDKLDLIQMQLLGINDKISTLETQVDKISKKQDDLESDTLELSRSVSFLTNEMDQFKKEHVETNEHYIKEVNQVKKELLYLNSYSRRENLKFFGIPEEDGENTLDKLYLFLQSSLELENVKGIEFQRVHRLGTKRDGKHRPIIARFLRFPEREMVMRNAFKLKGTAQAIMEDFPKEIIEARRKLIPMLKDAKRQGKRANFSKLMPDKLVINGVIT